MKLQRSAGFEPLFRTLRFLIFVAISSGVISSRVALAATDEVQVFRDAFVASDFAKVAELIEQYRKSSKPLPKDEDGKTLLHHAIQVYSSDHARFVRMLLNAGVDVNACAWENATPLHFAARFDCPPCAQELIAAGAKVNQRDREGWTPIFQAGHEMLPILVKAGADIRVRDPDGNLPLHRNFKQAFIAAGIDVNVRNNAGLTPLHFAALAGNTSAIKMLIANGAEPSARTVALGKGEEVPAGSTPLDLARLQYNRTKWSTGRHKPAVELLQKIQRMKRK